MEEYEAYIDQLPAKLIKMLEETSGQPPSEEELREIYDAHSELKRNVQLLKEEMNDKVEKMRILSERMNTEKDAKPLDLVTELMDSCGIPCDEEIDDTHNSNESAVSNETDETKESNIDINEAEALSDWEEGACGIDFKKLEELRESSLSHEINNLNITNRTYDDEEYSSFNSPDSYKFH